MTTPLEKARAAYGPDMPDWIEVLAIACERSSQAAVARLLGRTGAVVSQVLANRYQASTARIEERVRGVLMNNVIECPALGSISTDKCQDWREKAGEWSWGSPLRTRMYRACRKCPRHISKETDE